MAEVELLKSQASDAAYNNNEAYAIIRKSDGTYQVVRAVEASRYGQVIYTAQPLLK